MKEMGHQMNEGYDAWVALKSVPYNIGLGTNMKKCLYEEVLVPRGFYGSEEINGGKDNEYS